MYKLSQLIGKQSITLQNADSQGVVCNAFFDKNLLRIKYLLLLSDDEDTRFFVDFKNLSSVMEDAVVIKSSAGVLDTPPGTYAPNPINLPAFNQDGKALGTIRDINMDGEIVLTFVTDSGEIPAGTLLSRSDSIVVFNDTGAPIKIKKPKASGKNAKKSAKDSAAKMAQTKNMVWEEDNKFSPIPATGEEISTDSEDKKPAVGTPPKVMPPQGPPPVRDPSLAKFSFLLGKRLQQSIYTSRGFLIAREDDMITEKIIKSAKENGKLVAIALHSL